MSVSSDLCCCCFFFVTKNVESNLSSSLYFKSMFLLYTRDGVCCIDQLEATNPFLEFLNGIMKGLPCLLPFKSLVCNKDIQACRV